MDPVEVVLEEYRTLREEALQSIRQQQTMLQVGLAILGVLVTVGANLKPIGASAAVLGLFAPTVAVLVVFVWAGELERMARAGAHLVRLERRINELCQGQWPLQWETAPCSERPAHPEDLPDLPGCLWLDCCCRARFSRGRQRGACSRS